MSYFVGWQNSFYSVLQVITVLLTLWLGMVFILEGCTLKLVFSERELKFRFAICRRPSVCRLSVVCRLSSVVCDVRAPYSGD